ncbi:MAG: AraC family transcriptional regulator [Bacillales bacterium]|jgi:AraC family transcriptional regulator|nr:AraC family transcriptional regulator [Bacillales bacterium]
MNGGIPLRYTEILQKTLEYIDEHLKDDLDADTLASNAGFSVYHFSRVFRFYVGYSVMEYVRNRRLTFAVTELTGGKRIIDIALNYGFETHSGFSKAFRRHFGCSPETYSIHTQAKQPAIPILTHLDKYLIGGIIMEPKFVTRPAIKLVGYSITTTSDGNENNKEIPKFWNAYMTDGRMEKLHSEKFVKNHAEYGACFPENSNTCEFEYIIGIEPQEGVGIPTEYCTNEIPAATYAVFSSPKSNANNFVSNIQGTWQFIFNEWFPNSGYEYAQGCVDFELYDDRCMSEAEKVCDIYIPVSKKNN